MLTEAPKEPLKVLEVGQLWKTDNGFILITDHGKRLVGYKKLRNPKQRGVATHLIRPDALVRHLDQVGAELIVPTE